MQREWGSKKLPTAKRIENIAHEIDSKLQKGMEFKHTTKQKYEETEKNLEFIMETLLKDIYDPEEEKAKNEERDRINSLKHILLNDGFFEDLDY